MVFSSPIFLFAFLPLTWLLARFLPGLRAKNAALAALSLVFYAFGQLQYLPLFLCSILINYSAGRLLCGPLPRSRAVLTGAVLLNLGILAVFKYTDFVLSNLNALTGAGIPLPGIELPIGISFFTFQGLSYVIDSYRDPKAGTRDFLKLLLYISFFPQLIAGPIVKYHDIEGQIDSRVMTAEETAAGIRRFVRGLGKKLLIADAAARIADAAYAALAAGTTDARLMWLGAVCYSLQIYYDFSGYSDMAIGMGRMFGFTILENFRFPYAAVSIRDFWRRWHISLSTWFKEYLYIPLGGNRKGRGRAALNRFLVFFCTGIWHGANWTFVFWGLGHGLLSSLEDWGVIPVKRLEKSRAGRLLCRAYTMLAVVLLFAIFRADSLSQGFALIAALFTGGVSEAGSLLLARLLSPAAVVVLLLALALCGELVPRLRQRVRLPEAAADALSLGLLCLCILSLAKGGFHPFIYFQF